MATELYESEAADGCTTNEGALVLVVGPSGAGKDSIINGARLLLHGDARYVFPRRIITREVDETEHHAEVSEADFEALKEFGAFLFHWKAHGLSYGIPAGVSGELSQGKIVVINVSRAIVTSARSRFGKAVTVEIDAPADIRSGRLSSRARETEDDKNKRLQRSASEFSLRESDVQIVNDGALSTAIQGFVGILRSL